MDDDDEDDESERKIILRYLGARVWPDTWHDQVA